MDQALPAFTTLALTRAGRRLTIAFNRPDALNAFDLAMHDEFPAALDFAAADAASDVIVLTGHGRAFSAGGDLAHILDSADHPEKFDHEIAMAQAIVETLLAIEKPVVCAMNGHAVGLGATIALLCDIIYASDRAKIGDPHVNIGLVAGDGGAIVWPQRIGLTRAKEYLLTGDLITAAEAERIGLINRVFAPDALGAAVDELCDKLLAKPQFGLRKTKMLANLELVRLAGALLAPGLEWEAQSVRDPAHRAAVVALLDPPRHGEGDHA